MLRIIRSIPELRRQLAELRLLPSGSTDHSFETTIGFSEESPQRKRRVIGLVPTMGNLHDGHLRLVSTALEQCDRVIASIFVNPAQFGPQEDFASYPRTFDADTNKLDQAGCHFLFCPDPSDMYPSGVSEYTRVQVPAISENFCGRSRPGHFVGVATVVSKLFNLCQPDKAYFGLKDYQQYLVIRKLVTDLLFPVEITGVETVREPDGLALSSRNGYLDFTEKQKAPLLYQTLLEARDKIQSGSDDYDSIAEQAKTRLIQSGLQPDYFAVCNAGTLQPPVAGDREFAILAAAFLGKTRLIDNLRFTL